MLNKAQIIGHLGNDPETKYTQAGAAVTNISVATTEKWKDREGNAQERTEWHRVVCFGKLAEIAGEYLKKGRQVYVEGRLQTDKYEKDGVTHYTTKIVADEIKFLGKAEGGGGDRSERPAAPRQSSQAPSRPAPRDDFADDDIPF